MAVAWEEFEEVEESPVSINWEEFEPADDDPNSVGDTKAIDRARITEEVDRKTAFAARDEQNHDPIYNELLQVGAGVTKGLGSMGETVAQGLGIVSDVVLPKDPQLGKFFRDKAESLRISKGEIEEFAEGNKGSGISRALAEGGTSMAQVIGPGGLVGGAVRAAAQSGLLTLGEAEDAFRKAGDDPETARSKSILPALSNAAITFAVTKLGGNTGPEAIKELVKSEGFRKGLHTIGKNFVGEWTEEASDRVGSSIVEKLSYNPELTLDQAFKSVIESGNMGAILGGGLATGGQVVSALASPARPAIEVDPVIEAALPKSAEALQKSLRTDLDEYGMPKPLDRVSLNEMEAENDPLKSKFTQFTEAGTEAATETTAETEIAQAPAEIEAATEEVIAPENAQLVPEDEVENDPAKWPQPDSEERAQDKARTVELLDEMKQVGMFSDEYAPLFKEREKIKNKYGGREFFHVEQDEAKARTAQAETGPSEEIQPASQISNQPDTQTAVPVEGQTAQPELKGMGGAVESEFGPVNPNSVTSIKNAQVDEERAKRGMPPAVEPLRRTLGQVWDGVMAEVDQNPIIQDQLISELKSKPRALTDREDALILHKQVQLQNEYDRAAERLFKANQDNNQTDIDQSQMALDEISNALFDLYEIGKASGTETGRGLNARKMLARQDYSLQKMLIEKRVANGGQPLTVDQTKEVQELHDKIHATQKSFDEYVEKAQQRISELEAQKKIDQILKEPDPDSDVEPRVKSLAERIVTRLEKDADVSRKRLRELLSRTSVGVDPEILLHGSRIGAYHLAKGLLQFSKWSKAMVADFGDVINPYLKNIWDASNTEMDKRVNAQGGTAEQKEKVKQVVTKVGTEERKAATVEKIKNKVEEAGKEGIPDISNLVQKLARNFVTMGEKTRQGLIDSVHAELEQIIPGITKRETMDAISGYGQFKQLSKDEVSVRLRDLKGQMQQVAKLETMQEGQAPKKTGLERRIPSTEEHRLILQVNEAKRKGGYTVTDAATQLKSALGAIKTRLRNEITDLSDQLASKSKIVKTKTTTPYDAEAKTLLAQRNVLKQQFDAMFGKPGITDDQRIKSATESLQKTIKELENRIAKKDISTRQKASKTPQTPEILALKNRRDILQKEMDKLRELANPKKTPEERSISAYRTRLKNEIASLQKQIETKTKTPQVKKATPSDPQNEALKQKRDKLKEEFDQIFGKKKISDEQRLNLAMKAVERSITDLTTRIANNDIAPRKRFSKVPPNAALDAAKLRQEALREQLEELRELAHPKKTPEQRAMQSFKTRTRNQIADLQERLAKGDYSTRPKNKLDISQDPEAISLKAKAEQAKKEFAKNKHQDQLRNRTTKQKAIDFGKEVLNLPRAAQSSMDVSAVLRQGGFITFGNPVRSIRAMKLMFRTLKSEKAAIENQEQIRSRPNAPLYARSKLYLPDVDEYVLGRQEEQQMSRFANRIPGIKHSNRAFISFLNKLRADSFDAMVASLVRKGQSPSDAELKAIANFINISTGRGDMGRFSPAAEALSTTFYAPRYLLSRIQLYSGMPVWKESSPRVKAMIGWEYGKWLVGLGVIYSLAAFAGADFEDDPNSSDFGKFKFGNTRIDPLGGLLQLLVLVQRMKSGKTKSMSGKTTEIDRPNTMFRFVRTKFSPLVGAAFDLSGKDVTGKKVTPGEVAWGLVSPLSWGDIIDIMEEHGVTKGTAIQLVSFLGFGAQHYKEREESSNYRPD